MGFIVSQSIYHPIYGEIPSFYCRIENYRLNKISGNLFLKVGSYYDKNSVDIVNHRDLNDVSLYAYPIDGEIEYSSSVIDMNQFNYVDLKMTSSYYITNDIYEEIPTVETTTYFEYDDDGNMFETSSEETVYKITKVGESYIESTRLDFSAVSESLYGFSYNMVKDMFGEVFGMDNIYDY
jgi:hypothetical protein